MPNIIAELAAWGASLPPEWILLFALPFAVAITGLLATRPRARPRAPDARILR